MSSTPISAKPQLAKRAKLGDALQESFRQSFVEKPPSNGFYIELVIERLPGGTKIEVRMERNHKRPHFHARCSDACDVSVDIQTAERLAGNCDGKVWRQIVSWAYLNRGRLQEYWDTLNNNEASSFTVGQ